MNVNTRGLIINLLPAVFIGCHFTIQIWGTLRLRSAREKIAGSIKSAADLNEVKRAIQTNLLLGLPLMCNLVPMLVSLCLVRGMVMFGYIILLGIGQTILWFTARPLERQFKALPIVSTDESLGRQYRSYVEQWSGFCIFLKPPQ
jgi:hypothetical protein